LVQGKLAKTNAVAYSNVYANNIYAKAYRFAKAYITAIERQRQEKKA